MGNIKNYLTYIYRYLLLDIGGGEAANYNMVTAHVTAIVTCVRYARVILDSLPFHLS